MLNEKKLIGRQKLIGWWWWCFSNTSWNLIGWRKPFSPKHAQWKKLICLWQKSWLADESWLTDDDSHVLHTLAKSSLAGGHVFQTLAESSLADDGQVFQTLTKSWLADDGHIFPYPSWSMSDVLPAETLMNSDWLMTAMLFKSLLKTDWLIHAHDSESCYFKSVIPKIIPQLHNMPAHVFGLLIMFGKKYKHTKTDVYFY